MDIISDLVRNVSIIILLAIFIEMLLPNNDFSRYLQLVMGLFIVIAILTPIVSVLDKDNILETSFWQFTSDNKKVESILTSGKEIMSVNKKQALQEYTIRIEKQINALVTLVPGVEEVESLVIVNEDDNDSLLGAISKVEIWVSPVKGEIAANANAQEPKINIEKIEIGKGNKNREPPEDRNEGTVSKIEKEEISEKILKTVSNFYGLSEKQIKIYW